MDIHLELNHSEPMRAQLERELRAAIRGGRMRAGSRLPSSRLLAQSLGVSRGVVVEAYSQLTAEGYLVARTGEGTRIAEGFARRAPAARAPTAGARPTRYDLRPGVPDLSLFPRREWQAAMSAAVRDLPDVALGYGPPGGLPELRVALSDYLGRVRALVCEPEQVLIASGVAQALNVLCQVLRAQGARRIAVEDPGTATVYNTIERAGLDVVPIWVDEHGLEVARLERADVDAVVLSPAHQYPTGAVLAQDRRLRLLAWARQQATLVVEYESDAEYRYGGDAIGSLQGGLPDRVVYIGTAATALAPAVQLAWLVAPSHLRSDIASQRDLLHAAPCVLTQAAYATLLERGTIDRHLRRARRRYRARRAALIEALADHLPQGAVGGGALGLHLMLWLPESADEAQIARYAAEHAVAVHTLHHDSMLRAARPPGLVLGFGLVAEAAIPRAVKHLADGMSIMPTPRPATESHSSAIGALARPAYRRPSASRAPSPLQAA